MKNQIQSLDLLSASQDLCDTLDEQLTYDAKENPDIINALKIIRAVIVKAKGRANSRTKVFLVTAFIRDGESERYGHALIRARHYQSAEKKAGKLFSSRHGLDTDKAYFGRRSETYSELHDLKEIPESVAEVLEQLSLVHYA